MYIQHIDIQCSVNFLTLLIQNSLSKSSEMYFKLGQFQYHQQDFTPGPIQQLIYDTNYSKTLYFGQLKGGADIKEGIGIAVINEIWAIIFILNHNERIINWNMTHFTKLFNQKKNEDRKSYINKI